VFSTRATSPNGEGLFLKLGEVVSPSGPSLEELNGDIQIRAQVGRRDDAGTFETSASDWKNGDTLIADGNRRYRATAVIPLPRLEEFLDGALNGVLEVEQL
jgi:hypothetical protein